MESGLNSPPTCIPASSRPQSQAAPDQLAGLDILPVLSTILSALSQSHSLTPPHQPPHQAERSVRWETGRCCKYKFLAWFREQSVRLRTRAVQCPALSSGQSDRSPRYHSISPSKAGRGACHTGRAPGGNYGYFLIPRLHLTVPTAEHQPPTHVSFLADWCFTSIKGLGILFVDVEMLT